MTIPLARTVRKLKQAISGRLPQRRDDSGLTTLEWLLIVAAVAGLAALAVVLVQNVVSDTAEQIGSNSARMTSAELTAVDITSDARAFVPAANVSALDANKPFKDRCERMNIAYGRDLRCRNAKAESLLPPGGKSTYGCGLDHDGNKTQSYVRDAARYPYTDRDRAARFSLPVTQNALRSGFGAAEVAEARRRTDPHNDVLASGSLRRGPGVGPRPDGGDRVHAASLSNDLRCEPAGGLATQAAHQ